MLLNQIQGALFGLAIGDAMGGTAEFMTPDEIQSQFGTVTDIIGGGVWRLQPGETTDDTAMTIAVAKGILCNPQDPIPPIGEEFLKWYDSNPKDIGNIIREVFRAFKGDWFEAARQVHEMTSGRSAGNGSLMRCLPVALAYNDLARIEEITRLQSKMTHYDDLAAEACRIYNRIAFRILAGENLRGAIETEVTNTRYEVALRNEPNVPPNGFVVDTFMWVLYILWTSETFEEVVQTAANLGGDSDTIGAIAGGLSGLSIGYDALPERYKEKILVKQELTEISQKLFRLREEQTSPNMPVPNAGAASEY